VSLLPGPLPVQLPTVTTGIEHITILKAAFVQKWGWGWYLRLSSPEASLGKNPGAIYL
jgi:hypothetical protein